MTTQELRNRLQDARQRRDERRSVHRSVATASLQVTIDQFNQLLAMSSDNRPYLQALDLLTNVLTGLQGGQL